MHPSAPMSQVVLTFQDLCPKTRRLRFLSSLALGSLYSESEVTGVYLRAAHETWPAHYALREEPNKGERCLKVSTESCHLSTMPAGFTDWRPAIPVAGVAPVKLPTADGKIPHRLVVDASHVYNENRVRHGVTEHPPLAVVGFAFARGGEAIGVNPDLTLGPYSSLQVAARAVA